MVERFKMYFYLKDSQGSSGIYSFNLWASSNIIIELLESKKGWKEELVVLEGQWMVPRVPAEEKTIGKL